MADFVKVRATRQFIVHGGQVVNPGEVVEVDAETARHIVEDHKSGEFEGAAPEAEGDEKAHVAALPSAERAVIADEVTAAAQQSQATEDVNRARETEARVARRDGAEPVRRRAKAEKSE